MEKKGKTIIWGIILVIILVIGFFAYSWYQNEKAVLSKAMTVAAEDYFSKYVSSNTASSAYEITLEDLKKANDDEEEYDLSALVNCDDKKTVATVSINFNDGTAKSTEVSLKCGIFK